MNDYLKTLEETIEELEKLGIERLTRKEASKLEKLSWRLETLVDAFYQEEDLRESLEIEAEAYMEEGMGIKNPAEKIKKLSNDALAKLIGYKGEMDYIFQNIHKYKKLVRRIK